jgi:hypothetical protein
VWAATGRVFVLPRVDLVPAVERYFDFVQRTVDINRRVAVRWEKAAGTMSGAVREKAGLAGDVVREKARQRYEGMPKAQLSDLLARRDLPKTGNIDELIERLGEADNR